MRSNPGSLAATVDNIRLYPPESELITLTLDQLDRHTQELFECLPSLTVAMAEGTVVVNATRPNPRQFGITIEILQRLMEESGLFPGAIALLSAPTRPNTFGTPGCAEKSSIWLFSTTPVPGTMIFDPNEVFTVAVTATQFPWSSVAAM